MLGHPGELIDGRYLVREIRGGQGKTGMGVVYIVEDGGKLFAMKTFQSRFATNLSFIERFIREARTWMLIGFHPNVVGAFKLDIFRAIPCLFMEYVPSNAHGYHSLGDYLREGPMPEDRVLCYAVQFCEGMIHALGAVPGLVHRDIKPDNLLITPEGVLKISDFGLVRCKAFQDDGLEAGLEPEGGVAGRNLTRAGTVFGTPPYMSPEQFRGASSVTFHADMYAFGCCLFEMLTGVPPFQVRARSTAEHVRAYRERHTEYPAPPLQDWLPGAHPGLNEVIQRCLAKQPGDRWESYEALQAALRSIWADVNGGALPQCPGAPPPAPKTVAGQLRSIALLDGYTRAVRLKNLREHHAQSPYAFHLALASYFHVNHDAHEEERQLLKAHEARAEECGYEAVRRLAELYLDSERFVLAETILEGYLSYSPGGLDSVLEPYVRLKCHQHDFETAHRLLDAYQTGTRGQLLKAMVYNHAGEKEPMCLYLRQLVEELLDRIEEKLAQVETGQAAGWAQKSDRYTLEAVLLSLRPEAEIGRLRSAQHTVWPDLLGYPDFSQDMAWLSEALGRLGENDLAAGAETQARLKEYAEFLDYPRRLQKHLERDEYWFWMQQGMNGSGHD